MRLVAHPSPSDNPEEVADIAIKASRAASVPVHIRCPWESRQVYRDAFHSRKPSGSMEYTDGSAIFYGADFGIIQVIPDSPID